MAKETIGFNPQSIEESPYHRYIGRMITVSVRDSGRVTGKVEKIIDGRMIMRLEYDEKVLQTGDNTAVIALRDIIMAAPQNDLYLLR